MSQKTEVGKHVLAVGKAHGKDLGDKGLGRGCCIVDSITLKAVNCSHHCIPSVLPSAWHIENTQ